MKPLTSNPELRKIAASIIWFEPPETALRDRLRFLAYAMAHATARELAVLRKYVGDKEFAAALAAAPPGVIDKRSWAYWHAMIGRSPVPRMPDRSYDKSQRKAHKPT